MSATTYSRLLAAALLLGAGGAARGQGITYSGAISADADGQALKVPEGVACGPDGSLVIADTGNARLLAVTVAGANGGKPAVKVLKLAELAQPTRVRMAKDGALLVLDRKKRAVARVVDGKFAGWIEVPGEPSGSTPAAAFATDAAGDVFLLDLAKNTVVVVEAAGTVRRISGPAAAGALVHEISADADGTLYGADAVGRQVWIAPPGTNVLKPFSKPLADVMSFPGYIAPHKGRIYVVDQNGSGLVLLGQDGAYVGRRLSLGWTDGLLRYPGQICFDDGAGQMFVADRQNNRVQSFEIQ